MNKSWKVNGDNSDPLILRVEIRVLSEVEDLSRDALDKVEHVIVTSVQNVIRRTTKKEPLSRMVSELILYEPRYKVETRYFSEVSLHSPPFVEEEE